MAEDKKSVEEQLAKVRAGIVDLGSRIDKAEADGDEKAKSALMEDLMILGDHAKDLESSYSSLMEQEQAATKQDRAALEKELAAPIYESKIAPTTFDLPTYSAYAPVMPRVTPPDPEAKMERNREIAGQLLNAPVSPDGREAEMLPAGLRAQIGSLPNLETKAQLLKKNFPDANITPLNVGGNTEFFLKMPDGTVKTTFESGLAGLAGAAAVEIPLTAAQIGAGLGAAGITASPVVGLGASALTRLGLGTAIDEALRFGYGVEQNVGESLGRRGTEAAMELALGGISEVAIPAARAARMPSPFTNEFARNLEQSATRLSARETRLAAAQGRAPGAIQVPAAAGIAGPEGLFAQQQLAGEFPRSGIAASARETQETLTRLFNNFRSNVPATANDFSGIAANRESRTNQLATRIAAATGRNERVIRDALERQFTSGRTSNIDELGNTLRTSILAAEEQAKRDVNEAYSPIFDLADQGGFRTTPDEMLDMISSFKREINTSGATDASAIKGVEERLRRRRDAPAELQAAITEYNKAPTPDLKRKIEELSDLSKPMGSRDFDEYIKAFRDARPENAVGGTTKDAFGAGIASRLSDYRRNRYSEINAELPDGNRVNIGDLFEQATSKVQERVAFEKNLLGNILREAGGEQATTPRNIVSAVMKEPATVDRVATALRQLGQSNQAMAGEADRILGLMQTQYLNDIGIGGVSPKSPAQIAFDPAMLKSLYGPNAGSMQRSLDSLNKNIRLLKGNKVSDLTFNDVQRMSQALTETERDQLTKTIGKRMALEKEQREVINSQIFKLAKSTNFSNVDPDVLSKAILSDNSTVGQVRSAMTDLSKLSPESRNLYKGDFVRELLDQFPGGTPTANAPFTPLFDAKKFISAYESPGKTGRSQFATKLETVLGKEDANFLYDLAKTYDANTIVDLSKSADARLIAGREGVSVYLTTGLASKGRNRLLAAMLSSGSKRHGLKTALARNALPGGVNKAYNDMFREAFLTRQGITALGYQAAQDPEFSAELTNMAREFRQKEGIDTPEIIAK
jgi:hypothetical protein